MTYQQWIQHTTATLQNASIASARLDSLLLLCDELGRDKAWVLAHDDQELTDAQFKSLSAKLDRREKHEPMAYIRGKQEFYGRNFAVTPDVLIPRPETESIIELLGVAELPANATIADIGTGSGAIAITVKLEHPGYHVIATDISASALAVARRNATTLGAEVDLRQGDLLGPLQSEHLDMVIANLPYVDRTWQRSPETDFEPAQALFANDGGLELIYQLIRQAADTSARYLLLESDPSQGQAIIALAISRGFKHHTANGYALLLSK